MHGFYNNNNVKVTGSGGRSSISPQSDDRLILGRRGRYGFTSSAFDPQIHNPLDVDSTLIRYSRATGASLSPSADVFPSQIIDSTKFHPLLLHRSNISPRGSSPSPLSSIENLETPPSKSPPVFATPVKVEEDVLVMDGILVGSVPGGRTRSGPDSGSSSSGNSLYKTEICRAWEDTGNCRYGSKCQFAHGKEELRPTRVSSKNKSEGQLCKSFATGTCAYGSKCRFIHHMAASSPSRTATSAGATTMIKPEQDDWSPADDGIEVRLPSSAEHCPTREDVNLYIHDVLYGPSRRKRLPVFAEICPN